MPDLIRALAKLLKPSPSLPIALPHPGSQKLFVPGGELLPVGMGGKPLAPEWSTEQAIALGYKRSALVYSAISSLAAAGSSVPWGVEVLAGDEWEPAPDSDLAQLLANPHEYISSQELIERIILMLGISGNSFVKKTIASGVEGTATLGRVLELTPLPTQGMQPIPDREEWLAGYAYEGSGKKRYEPEEIIHVMFPDPENLYWGQSPLQALARVIDTESESVDWNLYSMKNRSVDDGVFTSTSDLTKNEFDAILQILREQIQGSVNAHNPLVVGQGFQWNPMSRTPVEMDFVEGRKMYREDVLSGFHVPPVMAGFFDQATLANAEVSRRLFWVDAVIPQFLDRIKDVFTRSLVPHFGTLGQMRVVYDLASVDALRDNTIEKSKIFVLLVKAGVPYNEAVRVAGLPLDPLEGEEGDAPFGTTTSQESTTQPQGEGGAKRTVMDDIKDFMTDPGWGYPPGGRKAEDEERLDRAFEKVAAAASLISAAFADAINDHLERVDRAGIERGLRAMNLDQILTAFRFDELEVRYLSLIPVLEEVVEGSGLLAIEDIREDTGAEVVWTPALAAGWLAEHGQALSQDLSNSATKGVHRVFEMWQAGELGSDAVQAGELFAALYALNSLQAGVLGKFARDLGIADEARDPLLGIRVERMVRGLLRGREKLIGNQQATISYFRGQTAAWTNGVESGAIPGTRRIIKTWFDSGQGNVCPICISLHRQSVPMPSPFFSHVTGMQYWYPGDPHPTCNCGILMSSSPI
jgi:HK97 family phage portal protein